MSQLQVTGEAKIRDLQGPVVANSGVITALDGAASQYVRGDGTLADFPTQTGGGSSVSYYLNGSVNQGTFGGSTYYQMSKNAITGTGTNFSTSADGLLAQFITDANDPDATSIPSGNWNIEFFMNVSASSGALASFYVEFYKYNGTTFTLVATNVATPEVLTGTTTIDAYYTSVAFPETALLQTDRLAIRIYANVASKTVTLYTEDNRLCQVVTTFSRGILSLNNLTDQQQYFAVGTSGSDFNIVSSLDTHTFNIPTASATKRGLLSTTDWSTFNNKVPYTGATANVDLGTNNLFASFLYAEGAGGTSNGGLLIKQYSGAITAGVGYTSLFAPINQLGINFGGAYNALIEGTTLSANRTFTLPNITGTFALLQGNQNFIGFKQFSDTNSTWLDYGISMAKGSTPSSLSSSRVNVYSNSGDKNLVIADTFASFAKLQFQATGDLTYTFPSSSGTIALTSNLSSYVPYTGATTNVNLGFNLLTTNSINLDGNSASGVLNIKSNSSISTSGAGYVSLVSGNVNQLSFVFNGGNSATFTSVSLSASRTYSLPDASGTISLTSDLSAYVTLATNQTISGQKTFTQNLLLDGNGSNAGTLLLKSNTALPTSIGYTSINSTTNSIYLTTFVSNPKTAALDLSGLSDNAVRTFTFPNTSGTIALTSNLSSYLPLTGGTLTGALSGTSATFSGALTLNAANNQVRSGNELRFYRADNGIYTQLYDGGGANGFTIDNRNGDGFNFQSAGTSQLRISSTGAATFSSSVSAKTSITVSNTGAQDALISATSSFADGYDAILQLNSTHTGGQNWTIRSTNNSQGNFGGGKLVFNNVSAGAANATLVLTSAGNVGIGTSSPATLLHVASSGNTFLTIDAASASNSGLAFYKSGAASGAIYYLGASDAMRFDTASTERMRIDSVGRVLMNTTSTLTSGWLCIAVASDNYNAIVLKDTGTSYSSGNYYQIYTNSSNTIVGSISHPTATTVSFNTSSDYRLKEDLKDFNGLDILSNIKFYDFKWKDEDKRMHGVIAHELESLIPLAVSGTKDAINEEGNIVSQGVDYSKIVPILGKAIQEQTQIIKDLEARIVALESK